MPSSVDIDPRPPGLPFDWVRPEKPNGDGIPTPEKAFSLRYDHWLSDANACYWSGYSKSTATTHPQKWKQNGNVKLLIEKRGRSSDVVKVETEQDIMWVLRDLRKDLLAKPTHEIKMPLFEKLEKYLRLACQVGGVSLSKATVSNDTDDKGDSKPLLIRIAGIDDIGVVIPGNTDDND